MPLTAEQTSLEPLPYRGEQGGPRAVRERARLVNARRIPDSRAPTVDRNNLPNRDVTGRQARCLAAGARSASSGVDAQPAGIGSDLLRQDDAATSSDPRAWSVGMRGKALGRS